MAAGEEQGVRVTRTGIALVHEGEVVLPAEGSDATAEPVRGERTVIAYHFPVEIEIRGAAPQPDGVALVDAALRRLAEGLESAV